MKKKKIQNKIHLSFLKSLLNFEYFLTLKKNLLLKKEKLIGSQKKNSNEYFFIIHHNYYIRFWFANHYLYYNLLHLNYREKEIQFVFFLL